MARINIEECWWSDPRRTKLLLKIGFAADSAAVNMWRTAQEFWGKNRGLIPKEVFDKLQHAPALVEAGLADVRDRSVYVRGCSEYLDWHAEKREQASAAGKKSAEVRRKNSGSAQPKGGKGAKKTERQPNAIRTNANGTEPSDSGSKKNEDRKIPNTEPSSPGISDAHYQFEDTAKIKALLTNAFAGKIAAYRLKAAPRILASFGSVMAFQEWAERVINNANCPDPTQDFDGFDRYFGKALSDTMKGAA